MNISSKSIIGFIAFIFSLLLFFKFEYGHCQVRFCADNNIRFEDGQLKSTCIANFSYTTPTCANQSVYFTDLSSTSYTYITQWHWDFGDGTSMTVNFPNSPSVAHMYASPGAFTVVLSITTLSGCTNSFSQVLIMNPIPIADFTNTLACTGNPVCFTDLSQENGGGSLIEWFWDFGDPASGIANTSTLQNPCHTYSYPDSYIVMHVAGNVNGCRDTIMKVLTVLPGPWAAFTYSQPLLNQPIQFTDESTGNVNQWNWNFGDDCSSQLQNPIHVYNMPGQFLVSLAITDIRGCANQEDTILTVLPVGIYQGNELIQLLNVYPNPAREIVSVTSVENIDRLLLKSIQGPTLLEKTQCGLSLNLDMRSYNAGIYLLDIEIQGKHRFVKIIKI